MEEIKENKTEEAAAEVEQKLKSFTYHSPDKKFAVCGVLDTIKFTDGLPELKVLKIGLSLRNDMDNYSRKLGHKIALGRAMKNPLITMELDETSTNPAKAFYGYAKVYELIYETVSSKQNTVGVQLVTVKNGKAKSKLFIGQQA